MDSDLSRAVYASEAAADDDLGAIRFRVVRDFGDTLNVTFGFLRENGRELGLALLAIAGPVALLANVASGIVQARMFASMATPASVTDPLAPLRIFTSPAYYVALLMGMIAPFLVLALTFAYVRGYRRGEAGTLTPSRLWAEAKGTVGPLLLFYLAILGAFMGGALVNLIPCLGTLAFLAAGVYATPVLSVAFVVRAEEGTGIVASWKRADALARPKWGQTFGVFFLSWLLLGVVAGAVALVTIVPAFVAGGLSGGMTQPPLAVSVMSSLVGVLLVLAYALPFLASVFQYHSLAERAEGAGFGADLAALATPLPPPPPDPTFMGRASSPVPLATAEPSETPGFRDALADAAPATTPSDEPGFRDIGDASPASSVPPADAPPVPPASGGGFRGGGFGSPAPDDR